MLEIRYKNGMLSSMVMPENLCVLAYVISVCFIVSVGLFLLLLWVLGGGREHWAEKTIAVA